MKLQVIAAVLAVAAVTLYAGTAHDAVSAYSPETKLAADYENIIIDEEEGEIYDGSLGLSESRPPAGIPAAHHRIPGLDGATWEFLQKRHLGPVAFQKASLVEDVGSAAVNAKVNAAVNAKVNAKVTSEILNLPWVRDGLTDRETVAAAWLAVLDDFSPAAASRIAAMPFLRTFGPADKEAIQSLTYLAQYDDENDTNVLLDVLDNPYIADGGGIDDSEAKVVAVVGTANYVSPELVDVLLDPSQTSVAQRSIRTSNSGAILLAIIRTGPGSASTMDLLEHSVREAEVMMDQSFPTDYVGLLVAEDAVPDGALGANFGTNIVIRPDLDVGDRSDLYGGYAGFLIAHETAHYYWNNSVLWIDEGAADFMAGASEHRRIGGPMEVDNPPCPYYRTIFHLELSNPRPGTWGAGCNYALGERMFLDLHSALGDARFYPGFRALHTLTQADDTDTAPVDQLTTAFRPTAQTLDQKAILNFVLARRYGSILLTDTSPVNPALPALNSQVENVELVRRQDGEIIERQSGFAQISASRISDRYWLSLYIPNSIPLPAEREVEYEMVEYYEDGFVLDRRTYTVTYPAGYDWDYTAFCCIGFIPNYRWPTGLYWVYVYHEDRKIAELRFEVTP